MENFKKLVQIMAALRSENGCPWDREQTRQSLTPFLVEETYEVLDAIESNNTEQIKEELGDLLFQIIFHCQVAKEAGEFDINAVIDKISRKMVHRHPHVFGDEKFETSEEVLKQWEERKKEEGKQRGSILEGIPKQMPSLLRAHRIQSRAARVGFDWDKKEDVIKKLDEEVEEFKEALGSEDQSAMQDELGDVFFSLVNIARFIGVNPEEALRRTISKFIHRFRYIEMRAADTGKKLSEMSLQEMDSLWNEAKNKS